MGDRVESGLKLRSAHNVTGETGEVLFDLWYPSVVVSEKIRALASGDGGLEPFSVVDWRLLDVIDLNAWVLLFKQGKNAIKVFTGFPESPVG